MKVLSMLTAMFAVFGFSSSAFAYTAPVIDLTPITDGGANVALIGGAILLVVLAITAWRLLRK